MARIKKSIYVEEGWRLLEDVKGKMQSAEERKQKALELATLIFKEGELVRKSEVATSEENIEKLIEKTSDKAFVMNLLDRSFRSRFHKKGVEQIIYLVNQYGVPSYLTLFSKLKVIALKFLGAAFPGVFLPPIARAVRRNSFRYVVPAEDSLLAEHLAERKKEGLRLNLYHIGEGVLGEKAAQKWLSLYLEHLAKDDINYITVKLSALFPEFNLIPNSEMEEMAAQILGKLCKVAKEKHKFVMVDMEESPFVEFNLAVFKKVLEKEEFKDFSAGVTLQAYLPISYNLQKDLTAWAKERVTQGGANIKICIVKGAYLSREQGLAAKKGWPQAPYTTKLETDSNFKRMLVFALDEENFKAVKVGIGTHNIFDIAFALILKSEKNIEKGFDFEMLEGSAIPIRKAAQQFLPEGILLYCATAYRDEFQRAITYLGRRIEEVSGSENFLSKISRLEVGNVPWEEEVANFKESLNGWDNLFSTYRHSQDRNKPEEIKTTELFTNEADTDFSLPQNREWLARAVEKALEFKEESIPLVIGGQEIAKNYSGIGYNPALLKTFYRYTLIGDEEVTKALNCAQDSVLNAYKGDKTELFSKISELVREHRGDLLAVMLVDGGKEIQECDSEISRAIDNLEYAKRRLERSRFLSDLEFKSKGVVLIRPSWNAFYSDSVAQITAALCSDNAIIFCPPLEMVLSAWHLLQLFWKAGVSREQLQFIMVSDEFLEQKIIGDKRVNSIFFSGSMKRAQAWLRRYPSLDISGNLNGKNTMIITAMCDRDAAIKGLLISAFSYSGQKFASTSLAILEGEVYDDPSFLSKLQDAAKSLKCGNPWDLKTKLPPLIHEPNEKTLKALTSLEKGEEWLLKPEVDPKNFRLWSAGIKMGIQEGSFFHQNIIRAPLLGLMRAENLSDAIEIVNRLPSGLVGGLQSLDEREHVQWLSKIKVGNRYINRSTIGESVRRDPFGGIKKSSMGKGFKIGGPNYIFNGSYVVQKGLPREKLPISAKVNSLTPFLEKIELSAEQLGLWYASTANYAFWWKKLKQQRDPAKIIGEDNLFGYLPCKHLTLRVSGKPHIFDDLLICAAALTIEAPLEISWNGDFAGIDWRELSPMLAVVIEDDDQFIERVKRGGIERVRTNAAPTERLKRAAALSCCYVDSEKVVANGRYELLHYLQEVSLSRVYHRYGYLGTREEEIRGNIT